jgi:hypothetical protein
MSNVHESMSNSETHLIHEIFILPSFSSHTYLKKEAINGPSKAKAQQPNIWKREFKMSNSKVLVLNSSALILLAMPNAHEVIKVMMVDLKLLQPWICHTT